jgi:hypothetical protein
MELLLNLVWLGVSATLVWRYLVFSRARYPDTKWRAIVALALLILVLFPAISMTDDLAAFSNPGETNHLFRRDGSLLQLDADVAAIAIVALLLDIFAMVAVRLSSDLFRRRSLSSVLLDGAMRSLGLRPPPVAIPLAA